MLTKPRKLFKNELSLYADHLIRLSADDRALRFSSAMGDEQIRNYVSTIDLTDSVIRAIFDDELKIVGAVQVSLNKTRDLGEAAFSIDDNYRGQGLANELFSSAIRWLRVRNVKRMYTICLSHNVKMQAVAKKSGMTLLRQDGEVEGHLSLDDANPLTYIEEATSEQIGWSNYLFNATLNMI